MGIDLAGKFDDPEEGKAEEVAPSCTAKTHQCPYQRKDQVGRISSSAVVGIIDYIIDNLFFFFSSLYWKR